MPHTSETQPSLADQESSNRWLWFFLKLLLALALLGVVLSKVRLEEVQRVWRQVSWGWLPFYFLFSFANILAVAWRYHLLLNKEVPFPQVLKVVLLQTSLGNLVFNVAGFATYVAMMRGQHQVGVGRGVATLVAARFLDLVVVLPALALATWWVWPKVARVLWLPLFVLGGITLTVIVVGLVVIYRRKFLEALIRISDFVGLNNSVIIKKVFQTLTVLAEEQSNGWRPQAVPLVISSFLIMAGGLGVYYCNLRTFGLSLSLGPLIFIYFFCILPTFFPIVVLGGLGVTDISGLYLFGLFDFGPYTIAPVILGNRVLFYGANLLVVMCYLILGYWLETKEMDNDIHN